MKLKGRKLPAVINYSLTTYWYVIPPYRINIKPDPEALKKPVPPDPADPPPASSS